MNFLSFRNCMGEMLQTSFGNAGIRYLEMPARYREPEQIGRNGALFKSIGRRENKYLLLYPWNVCNTIQKSKMLHVCKPWHGAFSLTLIERRISDERSTLLVIRMRGRENYLQLYSASRNILISRQWERSHNNSAFSSYLSKVGSAPRITQRQLATTVEWYATVFTCCNIYIQKPWKEWCIAQRTRRVFEV